LNGSELVLVMSGSAARAAAAGARWGRTALAIDRPNELVGVVGTSDGDGAVVVDQPLLEGHAIALVQPHRSGLWATVPHYLHTWHAQLCELGQPFSPNRLRYYLLASLGRAGVPRRLLPGDGPVVVLTRAAHPTQALAAWHLDRSGALPMYTQMLPPPDADPIGDLGPHWPVQDLDRPVAVVGVGSIGGAAAHALARYGVRDVTLVDPDRLLPHNLVRHQCTRQDVGQYKVDAVRRALLERWPGIRVTALRKDVIAQADQMRPMFGNCALVVCAADGVAARRCVNHFARRAGCPAVFACVLRDGAVGEVLRVRPWPEVGCLLCARAMLLEHGAIDPEPALDADYGTGDPHRPMTAVGSDLTLVGEFAAKIGVATLLEEAGHDRHRFRDDWALIGLQLDRTAPAPFDLYPGQLHWLPEIPSRSDCPTCGTAP
jgi:hypothetical protein